MRGRYVPRPPLLLHFLGMLGLPLVHGLSAATTANLTQSWAEYATSLCVSSRSEAVALPDRLVCCEVDIHCGYYILYRYVSLYRIFTVVFLCVIHVIDAQVTTIAQDQLSVVSTFDKDGQPLEESDLQEAKGGPQHRPYRYLVTSKSNTPKIHSDPIRLVVWNPLIKIGTQLFQKEVVKALQVRPHLEPLNWPHPLFNRPGPSPEPPLLLVFH